MSEHQSENSEHQNTLDTQMTPDPDYTVGHSGNLGLEFPVNHLNTPLENAPVHPVPDTIDEFNALEPTPKPRKWLKPVAAAVAAAAIGGGAYLAGSSSGEGRANQAISTDEPAEEATEKSSAVTPSNDSSSETPAESPEPTASGSLDITRILEGEETISMEWNGQIIEIPRLRDTDDTKLFLESFFALESCYISTGNEVCLNELSDSNAFHEDLITIRNHHLGRSSNVHLENNGAPDSWQIAIYDNPEDPAIFTDTTDELGMRHIELVSGTLYQNYWHSPEWQGEDTKQFIDAMTYNFVTTDFRITVKKDSATNDIKITSIYWEAL